MLLLKNFKIIFLARQKKMGIFLEQKKKSLYFLFAAHISNVKGYQHSKQGIFNIQIVVPM